MSENINKVSTDGLVGTDEQVSKDLSKMLQDPAAFAEALKEVEQQRIGEYLFSLPPSVRRRIKALKKMQLGSVKLEAEFYKKVHELECSFANRFSALTEKRQQIVSGQCEPTAEEANFPLMGADLAEVAADELKEKAKISNGPESEEKSMETSEEDSAKGIPDFWLVTFKNVECLADMIQDVDESILKHLTEVDLVLSKEPMGFTLRFHFSPNEWFSNSMLTKEYTLKCDPDDDDPFEFDGPEIVACKGSTIDWKPNKNVTVKLIKKKQKHKQKGATRFVTKQVKTDSFFNFFDPPTVPEGGTESMDEETRDLLNADFEIGQVLRDRVIPRAVLYFTGEAHDDSFDEEEDDEEDDFDDEDDEEDDLDDDEDGKP